jgi:hypothetical protein
VSRKPNTKPQGQIRRSQLITTFGPGAMLDLPKHSVLIGGLDFWSKGGDEIQEQRLTRKLAALLNVPSIRLFTPPPDLDDPVGGISTGVDAFQFPEWFITQDVESNAPNPSHRSRMLVHRKLLNKNKYIDERKRRREVVPVRFVRACRAGHIGDIDWYSFVHGGQTECRRQLWIDERGTSGDLTEVWIRCECGVERNMSHAAILKNRALGICDGARPWLGAYTREQCGEPSRLLIRTASNAYFPQKMTVISLPDRDNTVKQAIDAAWENLEAVEGLEDLKYERRKAKVKEALDGINDDEALSEINSRRNGTAKLEKSVKVAELETLMKCHDEIGEDRPEGNFFARSLPRLVWNKPWMKCFERIVLVHRLREVAAQVGFTRFEPAAPDTEGELDVGVQRASLAREVSWLPAIENKGEGIFLQFRNEAIHGWLTQKNVQSRGQTLQAGFQCWREEHQGTNRLFPGLPYLLLHSFSHLLITSVSLECGYPASSIRERIYTNSEVGYGILLYTGSSDAEGTLGGLIQVGRRIHEHIHSALELGELCSNDPVCAQHSPDNAHAKKFLLGAACHSCLLIAETSCEQQNDYLDRSLVVATVENLGVEFFRSDDK